MAACRAPCRSSSLGVIDPAVGNLAGLPALVTGAGRGIGAAIARRFAAEGAPVMVADMDLAAAIEVAAEIQGKGGTARAVAHDVTDEAEWISVIAEITTEFGGLRILVNNAGTGARKAMTETSLAEWRRIMAVNCDGVFLGMKHAVPAMAEAGGSIINMASIYGKVGVAESVPYCASKGAVTLMTKAAALECAAHGQPIRINSLHPGYVETPLLHEAAAGTDLMETMHRLHPLGRLATPDEIADAALFLASDQSRFMTGAELMVDGGFTAQ